MHTQVLEDLLMADARNTECVRTLNLSKGECGKCAPLYSRCLLQVSLQHVSVWGIPTCFQHVHTNAGKMVHNLGVTNIETYAHGLTEHFY